MIINAENILNHFNIHTPPIDSISIAQKLNYNVLIKQSNSLFKGKEIYLNPNFTDTKKRFYCAKAIYHLLNNDLNVTKLNDIQSSLFATELLMPKFWIKAYLRVCSEHKLYEVFGVSKEAMSLRLQMIYIY